MNNKYQIKTFSTETYYKILMLRNIYLNVYSNIVKIIKSIKTLNIKVINTDSKRKKQCSYN